MESLFRFEMPSETLIARAMLNRRPSGPHLITIPSSDLPFREHVARVAERVSHDPADLEQRLRRIFPRVVVRERSLSGEAPAWYVYRDGRWQSPVGGFWWDDDGIPRVVASAEGWLVAASPIAAGLLGIEPAEVGEHHLTDFLVPGTVDDFLALFRVIEAGNDLNATVLVRSLTGDAIAVDLHASMRDGQIVCSLRLASDVDVTTETMNVSAPHSVRTFPPADVAFRGYTLRALGRMPEPTPDGLAVRLRRLYPHAMVQVEDEDWVAYRDPDAGLPANAWWADEKLPKIRYDAQALILEANGAAEAFLGHALVGHHWQEFVTPGSTEQVGVMLEILGEVGAAESRFRMPRADGTLVEFDSYTVVKGEEFETVMRPITAPVSPHPRAAAPPEVRGGPAEGP